MYFGSALKKKNERYRKNRHYDRCKSMNQFMNTPIYKPEEEILQVGCMGNTITKEQLLEIYQDYYKWHNEMFPEVKFLNVVLQMGEGGVPRLYIRRLWIVEISDGFEISQEGVLRLHDIKRPDLNKPKDRYNNSKMTYTKMVRDKLLEICLLHGVDVDTEVKDGDAKHLHPDAYKVKMKAETYAKQLEQNLEQVNIDINNLCKFMTDDSIPVIINTESVKLLYDTICKLKK